MMLYFNHREHAVLIEDVPSVKYANELTLSPHPYDKKHILGEVHYVPTVHSVKYCASEVLHSCLVIGDRGPTNIHPQSAFVHGDVCILAVSAFIVALGLPTLEMLWHIQVDLATCFGVYHLPQYASYISHGEIHIARISYEGEMIWRCSGKDIFTNGFTLHDHYLEAIDFNNEKYHIDLATGKCDLVGSV